MSMLNFYDQYKENTVNTSKPEDLVLMLYNGLIKFLMRAREAIISADFEGANINIIKAQDILLEFLSTLDRKYEISTNLSAMYDYMYRRLLEANTEKDLMILEEVLGYAREFRDTWAQAMKIAKQKG